ncbi:ankyrin repeat-containing protein [Botrytis cinerea]
MSLSDSFNLGKSLGHELVTIVVGKEKRKFAVHKQLICESVAYFRGAFSAGGFKESQECSMDMPEDEPGVFEYFMHWLYRGTVPEAKALEDFDQLLGVYIFAEKLCVNDLANKAIDAIQAITKSGKFHQVPDCKVHADNIWKNTSPTSPLRKWCIHELVYNSWDIEASLEKKKKKAFLLDMAELITLWELFKDHRDLYVSFFAQVQKHSADDLPDCPFQEENWDDCYFHRHSEGEVCHLKTAEIRKKDEDSEDEVEG